MTKPLQQLITEAMHFLSEQEEASSPAQAEELFRLSMQPLSEVLQNLLSKIIFGHQLSDSSQTGIQELIGTMQAIASSVDSDDDLVIPTTSVSTSAVGRIVSSETPGLFPIDDE